MICYKDKTWCTFSECKHSRECKSFLTKEEELKVDNWWKEFKSKDITPIAKFTTKPKCFEKKGGLDNGKRKNSKITKLQ